MSVTYRPAACRPVDPDDVLALYRRGGWRLLDSAYAKDDDTRRQLVAIVRDDVSTQGLLHLRGRAATPTLDATFDPAEWLDAYAAAGGWWAVTDERLWFGWPADPLENALALRVIYREVQDQPERLEAIRALVRERCLIA